MENPDNLGIRLSLIELYLNNHQFTEAETELAKIPEIETETLWLRLNEEDPQKIQKEIEKWQNKRPHKKTLSFYTNYISRAPRNIINSQHLMPGEKYRILVARLNSVENCCSSAIRLLENNISKNNSQDLFIFY